MLLLSAAGLQGLWWSPTKAVVSCFPSGKNQSTATAGTNCSIHPFNPPASDSSAKNERSPRSQKMEGLQRPPLVRAVSPYRESPDAVCPYIGLWSVRSPEPPGCQHAGCASLCLNNTSNPRAAWLPLGQMPVKDLHCCINYTLLTSGIAASSITSVTRPSFPSGEAKRPSLGVHRLGHLLPQARQVVCWVLFNALQLPPFSRARSLLLGNSQRSPMHDS